MRRTVTVRLAGRSLIVSWAMLLLVACTTSSAENPPAVAATVPGPTNSTELDRPAMWRMADDNSEVFLFGTFHLLPPDVKWTSTAYEAALRATENTIFEADIDSPEAVAGLMADIVKHAFNPKGVTLSQRLGSQRMSKVAGVAENLGISKDSLEPMQPWFAVLTLSQAALTQAGYNPAQGVESVILEQAKTEGDQLSYLESAASQIELLAGMDDEELYGQFDISLGQFEQIKQMTDSLLEAWRTGDVNAMEKQIQEPLRKVSPKVYAKLFTDRNANWTEQIDTLMMGEGNYFIAVGAGHLVGEGSVIAMLREKGYQVDRVQ